MRGGGRGRRQLHYATGRRRSAVQETAFQLRDTELPGAQEGFQFLKQWPERVQQPLVVLKLIVQFAATAKAFPGAKRAPHLGRTAAQDIEARELRHPEAPAARGEAHLPLRTPARGGSITSGGHRNAASGSGSFTRWLGAWRRASAGAGGTSAARGSGASDTACSPSAHAAERPAQGRHAAEQLQAAAHLEQRRPVSQG
jgi:hypothetical protein